METKVMINVMPGGIEGRAVWENSWTNPPVILALFDGEINPNLEPWKEVGYWIKLFSKICITNHCGNFISKIV